ncbi:MAG: Rha family transcriptional regulator [Ruminococcus sp.]|nr:Rha family transcriptional regulator [Ruminococcus sp.]
MNELTPMNFNGIDVVDSRQVAEAIGKAHKELLRDIRKYCDYLTQSKIGCSDLGERKIALTEKSNDFNERKIAPVNQSKIGLVDFFIKSTYTTEQNKEMPCYLCTRKGCEMIANKLTGKKGVVFTALYINAFHKMEKHYKQQNNYSGIDQTIIIIAIKELYEKNYELNDKISNLNKENYELKEQIERLNRELNKNNREFTAIIKILCEKMCGLYEKKKSRKSKAKNIY